MLVKTSKNKFCVIFSILIVLIVGVNARYAVPTMMYFNPPNTKKSDAVKCYVLLIGSIVLLTMFHFPPVVSVRTWFHKACILKYYFRVSACVAPTDFASVFFVCSFSLCSLFPSTGSHWQFFSGHASYCVSPCSVALCVRSSVFVSHQQSVLFPLMLCVTAEVVVSPHVFVHVFL